MSNNIFETNEGTSAVNSKNQIRESAVESEDELDHLMDEFEMEDSEEEEDDDEAALLRRQLESDEENGGTHEDDDDGPLIFSSDEEFEEYGIPIVDDYGVGYNLKNAIREAAYFKPKKDQTNEGSVFLKNAKYSKFLDPEVRDNLSKANEAFVRNDYQVAMKLYSNVVAVDTKNAAAWKSLGAIYKHQGDLDKCCNCWILAARVSGDEYSWAEVAELSASLGHSDQALYCYNNAIAAAGDFNSHYILERAILYKEKKLFGRALEGLQKLRQLHPTDSSIVKNVASVYVEQKRINDAINLYMKILDYNINPHASKKSQAGNEQAGEDLIQRHPKFGWAELNILLELYIQQRSWRNAIKVTKVVARWLQNRGDEKWWDDVDDDSEFDPKRRLKHLENMKPSKSRDDAKKKVFELPIDIRYKIGHLRLGLEQKDEAMRHFEFLLAESSDIDDLFFETGKILEEYGYYEDAIQYLVKASANEEFAGSTDLVALSGKCFLETADYSQAKHAYESLLSQDPNNLEYKISLAEAEFHLGNSESARILLQDVSEARQRQENEKNGDTELKTEKSDAMDVDPPAPADGSLIRTDKPTIRSQKLTDNEKIDLEKNAKKKVLEKFRRMKRLEDSINENKSANSEVAIKTWIKLAYQLLEIFISVKSFFPRDKNRQFKGIILYRRKRGLAIDEKLARVYNLYEGFGGFGGENNENYKRQFLTSKTEYRGISYDDWFNIFTQFAILSLNYDDNGDDYQSSNQMIDISMNVSVFIQDKVKESMLKLIKLIVGLKKRDMNIVTAFIRNFLIVNQFSPFIYKFFVCCFSSGILAWETFTNYNHQKFFLRHLKAFDSLLLGKKLIGMATITSDIRNIHFKNDHIDLLYVYANLLGGSRSYVSSIVYLNRAYKHYNQDPMVCLIIGLSHIHRSMQRLSTNRHIQLLQGISYLLEYKEIRQKNATDYELQEIEYNFGRLFHMIGLTSLAIGFYEKVLNYRGKVDEEYDMTVEAAYNLTLIYNINGNSQLARQLTEEYLTI